MTPQGRPAIWPPCLASTAGGCGSCNSPQALLPPLFWKRALDPLPASPGPPAPSDWLHKSPSETVWVGGEAQPGSRNSVSVQAPPLTSHVTLVLFFGSPFSYVFPEGVGLDNSYRCTSSLSLISLPGGRRSECQSRGEPSACAVRVHVGALTRYRALDQCCRHRLFLLQRQFLPTWQGGNPASGRGSG